MTNTWLRKDFAHLQPYDPAYVACDVMLSANENTAGMPPRVHDAIMHALQNVDMNRYPDPLANRLRNELAMWHNISKEHVIVGNGGDELLFNLLFALGGADATLVSCPPEFSIYALYASMAGMKHVEVPRLEDFSLDEPALMREARDAKVVFLTSPNNPTGNIVDPAWVAQLAMSTEALIVVDEAYIEFSDEATTCAHLVHEYENVAVLRTLSKAFGLAGVRCGYLLASPSIVQALAAVRQPYSVDAVAQEIAFHVVHMRDEFREQLQATRTQRNRVIDELSAIDGIDVWPSYANFILVRVQGAHGVYEQLRDVYSILVRDFSSTPGLQDCLRITIGTEAENNKVISALRNIACAS